MKNITKIFNGNIVNDSINFKLRKGEIHTLLGENGAGKSTLMNILCGIHHPNSGEIYLNGDFARINSPVQAMRYGIGMVHQNFMLIPAFSVLDNVILGMPSMKRGLIDRESARAKLLEIAEENSMPVNPDILVGDLSIGEQQQVEILKILYRGAKLLILDEPTAVLRPQEINKFFLTLRKLVSNGHSIIFISHKLDEVMEVSDRISILCKGVLTDTVDREKTDKKDLAHRMVGRDVVFEVTRDRFQEEGAGGEAETILQVSDLAAEGRKEASSLKGISFELKRGEILGVAGIEGNGQGELVEVLTGLRKAKKGTVHLNGEEITNLSCSRILEKGLLFVPEDRHSTGSVGSFSIEENMGLRKCRLSPFSKRNVLNWKAFREKAVTAIEEFDIRGNGPSAPAGSLSGGNLQKMVIAREMLDESLEVLVAVYPTRGIDVGAIEFVHEKFMELKQKNKSIILVSSELDEILNLSDRILVLSRGAVSAVVPHKDATSELIGEYMGGARSEGVSS